MFFDILYERAKEIIKNVYWSWCKVLVTLVKTFSADLRKLFKYQISWKSVQWKPSTSMRTDRHDKANSHFSQICESAYTQNITQQKTSRRTVS